VAGVIDRLSGISDPDDFGGDRATPEAHRPRNCTDRLATGPEGETDAASRAGFMDEGGRFEETGGVKPARGVAKWMKRHPNQNHRIAVREKRGSCRESGTMPIEQVGSSRAEGNGKNESPHPGVNSRETAVASRAGSVGENERFKPARDAKPPRGIAKGLSRISHQNSHGSRVMDRVTRLASRPLTEAEAAPSSERGGPSKNARIPRPPSTGSCSMATPSWGALNQPLATAR
jgi:hypothetical protein